MIKYYFQIFSKFKQKNQILYKVDILNKIKI